MLIVRLTFLMALCSPAAFAAEAQDMSDLKGSLLADRIKEQMTEVELTEMERARAVILLSSGSGSVNWNGDKKFGGTFEIDEKSPTPPKSPNGGECRNVIHSLRKKGTNQTPGELYSEVIDGKTQFERVRGIVCLDFNQFLRFKYSDASKTKVTRMLSPLGPELRHGDRNKVSPFMLSTMADGLRQYQAAINAHKSHADYVASTEKLMLDYARNMVREMTATDQNTKTARNFTLSVAQLALLLSKVDGENRKIAVATIYNSRVDRESDTSAVESLFQDDKNRQKIRSLLKSENVASAEKAKAPARRSSRR